MQFVAIPRRNSIELACLSLPWMLLEPSNEVNVEIAVQQSNDPAAFCASVTAHDEDCGVLLGYLASGSLPTARDIAEQAKEMLYYKMANPFAAAAGGYALVATASSTKKQAWHDWIQNLMNWFPHIPDGAILWARLNLLLRRSKADVEEAKRALKLAYERGLPCYSMGMRWLMEDLERMAANDPEAEQMLRAVRPIAWRTNYRQPFTILHLGGNAHV